MKLKHIFENQQWNTSQPPMTQQEVIGVLGKYFNPLDGHWRITIDSQGIHVHDLLYNEIGPPITRMPLQLASVHGITAKNIATLDNMPLSVRDWLRFGGATFQDLRSAPPIAWTGGFPLLLFSNCHNLTTLQGIEKFTTTNAKLQVTINPGCDRLDIDPMDYFKYARIEFHKEIPQNVKLVKAVAMSNDNQMKWYDLQDVQLELILDEYRGEGRLAMIPLARKLIANGYERHTEIT
jgi:hypothetical protein